MSIFYSPSERGFYNTALHAEIPADAVEITAEDHTALLAAQSAGAVIEPGEGGRPVAVVPPPAPPPVPSQVTNFQARAVLMGMPSATAGRTLFQDVDDALRAEGGTAWQAWEYANDITRDGVLVRQMAAQFGLTAAQLDDLFRQASAISA